MNLTQIFSSMLALQEQINQRIHADWRNQNHAWHRAIWVECAELLDHYGWKWWKQQSQDVAQVQLELIDIWHFGLSALLQQEQRHTLLVSHLLQAYQQATSQINPESFAEQIEQFVLQTLTTKTFNASLFLQLFPSVQLSMDELYRIYLSKNVLNIFRQDNGYQQGSYRKHWNGLEDNEHLQQIMRDLDLHHPLVRNQLYDALATRYAESN